MIDCTLDGMPPIKKPRKRVLKKHHTTKNVPVEISVRRQVAEEIGDAEPTKDQKFILLQKYGAAAPRIDRLNTKPSWMEMKTWRRLQNDWLQATKGLVRPEQRPRYAAKTQFNTVSNSRMPRSFRDSRNVSSPLQTRMVTNPQGPSSQRGQETSRSIRNNHRREGRPSPPARRDRASAECRRRTCSADRRWGAPRPSCGRGRPRPSPTRR